MKTLRLLQLPFRSLPAMALAVGALGTAMAAEAFSDPYYKQEPQFHMWPDPTAARYKIERFGPVGIGLDLVQPAFTMKVSNVEPGSPADATGQFKVGQIIESINGHVLKDEDPRVLLGNWITEAEAKDGVLRMMVKDDAKATAREVVVKIPALGPYSATWPVDCRKSDQLVRECADALAKHKDSIDIGLDGSLLFMLSTGEEKDLEVARGWVRKLVEKHKGKTEIDTYPWFAGYSGTGFCEYYLRTGDESILPIIEMMSDSLRKTIYNGAWMGRGGASFGYMAGGHLNAAGLHAVTFLLMAKECGVKVDEHTLQSSLHHMYRFAGHGNVAYGDQMPEGGFVSNGKTEGLAFTMQAAANLHPDGEKSVYARARDISATKAFYSTSWMFHGHTGGGIGEFWRGPAMGVVKDKRPTQYRSFMDERRWMYELARTHDGVFGWVSDWNVGYTDTALEGRGWGSYIPLIYTLPRKNLRLHGAPPSKYSHTYSIPDRPWGNEADDAFLSLTPGEYAPGKVLDITTELLPTHASKPLMQTIKGGGLSDEMLIAYAHHIDQGIRDVAASTIAAQGRADLVMQLLQSQDPRGRHAGLMCITGMKKGTSLPTEQITAAMFAEAGKMVENPAESWWVVIAALEAMERAQPEWILPHAERILEWMDHDDWWLRSSAMTALTPVAGHASVYQPFLAKIGKLLQTSDRMGDFRPLGGVVESLQTAAPEVQKYAMEMLGEAYLKYPKTLTEPGGQDLSPNIGLLLDGVADKLVEIPGGYDLVYQLSRERAPDAALPHQALFLNADAREFGPELRKAILPIIERDLIPQYVEANRKKLEAELSKNEPDKTVEGLVNLYQKAGVDDYDWKPFGPGKTEIEWSYLNYEPKDGKLWESGSRYRKLEWAGPLKDWFTPGFDPKAAGWKTGRAPFGSTNGKLEWNGSCVGNFCGCGEPLATLWDGEVLLMRAEIELPPLKPGHAYRLLVGGRSHVNAGDGSDIWIDGTYMTSRRATDPSISGVGKRQGGQPWGRNISDSFRPAFEDGKVVLCATGFMKFLPKTKTKANRQSFWFEEMKLPPLGK